MKYFLIALLCTLYVVQPAQAREQILDIQKVVSPGGIEAWLVEDSSIPVLALNFAFKDRGSALESEDKQGVARLVSNIMDEGAGDLDSQGFQKKLRDHVIDLSFYAGRDTFGGKLKTLTQKRDVAFDLLKLALEKPRFDQEALERMREANKARIRSSLADPEWIAARIMNDKAFAGHPYALNSGGTLSSLENITRQDLVDFYKTLSRDRLFVAVVGDIDAATLAAALDYLFTNLPETAEVDTPAALNLQNAGQTFLFERDIPQTIIEILQPGISRDDPDYFKATVLNHILGAGGFGSRLMEEIRENRGLTYGIYSRLYQMDHFDGLSVSTSTQNHNVPELLSILEDEWQKIRNEPVGEKELEDAKSYLIGSLPLSLTSTDRIAGILLSIQLDGLGTDYLDRRARGIKETTAEDILSVAQKLLNHEEFLTVMVGRPELTNKTPTIISTLPNVE